eukprot:scaffold402727_cov50-Prasinocladus_malaysianus.AAC.2
MSSYCLMVSSPYAICAGHKGAVLVVPIPLVDIWERLIRARGNACVPLNNKAELREGPHAQLPLLIAKNLQESE